MIEDKRIEDVNYFLSSVCQVALFGMQWKERGERIATVINFLIGIGMLDEF